MEHINTILGYPALVRVLVLILLGFPLLKFVAGRSGAYVSKRFSTSNGLLVKKVIWYSGVIGLFLLVFQQLGFSLTPLLGAAGIVGIALGFASQTSVSNIISGLFLISEKPFSIGDVISIDTLTGEVLSIDTLSVKLRTFDNRFVRIPNENVIKAQVINLTYFPIRRLDLLIGVAYKEDLKKIQAILLELCQKELLVLKEPKPQVMLQNFGNSAIEMTLAVWCERVNFLALRNSLMVAIKERFDREQIEIPFPQVAVSVSSSSDKPFDLRRTGTESAVPSNLKK